MLICKSAAYPACPGTHVLSQAITVGGVSEGGVELAGRSLNISMAVDRAQAKVLETQNKEKDEKKDARNLWLAKEGCMCPVTVSRRGSAGYVLIALHRNLCKFS